MSQHRNPNNSQRPRRQLYDYDVEVGARGHSKGVPPLDAVPRGARRGSSGTGRRTSPGYSEMSLYTGPRTQQRRQRKRRRRKRTGLTFLIIFLVLAGGITGLYFWLANAISGENTDAGTVGEETKSITIPEYNGKDIICGLICGIDYNNEEATGYVGDDHVGRTDMILYMMFDTVAGKASFLQIPRDSFVGEDVNTGGTGKINSVYFYADNPEKRMQALINVLYEQFGLPTDFYVTIDMDAVKALVDIIGGIEVYIPFDIKDPAPGSNSWLPAGWRNLTGQQAEFFLRNRGYADADITRLAVQQSFYSALFRQFKALTPGDLVKWMGVLLQYCNVGGLNPLELGGLAQKALGLTGENIVFARPSIVGAYHNTRLLVSLVSDEFAELLNTYFRPEGYTKTVDQLNIHELPMVDYIGKSEQSVRTMAGIQGEEPP